MRDVIETTRFRREVRRQKRRGYDLEKLGEVVTRLAERGTLPHTYHPHPLSGEWSGIWDCHITSDWLLLYEVTDTEVVLYRTGTHADLFE